MITENFEYPPSAPFAENTTSVYLWFILRNAHTQIALVSRFALFSQKETKVFDNFSSNLFLIFTTTCEMIYNSSRDYNFLAINSAIYSQ